MSLHLRLSVQPQGLPSALPLRRDADTMLSTGGLGAFQALAVVLMLMALLAWVLRRKGLGQGSVAPTSASGWLKWLAVPARPERLRVLESKRLTARSTLHLVQWGEAEWLIGCSDEGMEVLERRGPAPEVAPVAIATSASKEGA